MKKLLAALVLIIFVNISACTPKTAPVTAEAEKAQGPGAIPAVKEGWEAKWELMQREARKEGKFALYTTSGPDIRMAFAEALKKSGVELETITGRGVEMAEKIFRERRAGIYSADVFMSGLDPILLVLKPAGVLTPLEPMLILPEVKDPSMWYKGELPFIDKDKMILGFPAYIDHGIHVNTDIVKPGDINSMQDLLFPRWKGKIIMSDPTISGRGQNFMAVVLTKLGEEYVRQLAKQEPLLIRDLRQLTDWVAKGKYAIGIGIRPGEYMEYKRAGAPITNLPLAEVSYLLGGAGYIAYFERVLHPNASKVFLNWLLSREGQIIWQQLRNDQSARLDVPVDHLIKEGYPIRQPGVDYYDVRSEVWEMEIRKKAEKIIDEVFRPLVR